MSGSAFLRQPTERARERSEIERRRTIVARLRWLEDSLTAAEIADALQKLDPPIVVSIRTVELLQDLGLLDRHIGTLFIDDGKPVERIPSGEELQRRFESIEVTEGELVNEAERAWKHGEQVAAESSGEVR